MLDYQYFLISVSVDYVQNISTIAHFFIVLFRH